MLVKKFEMNEMGRDFAVGDIHGEFSLVKQAMSMVGFDGAKDRLFCVGDLIDRGSECHEVLNFLSLPGVHSIKGNHEDDLVEVARSPRAGIPKILEMSCHAMGVSWWFVLEPELREDIICAIESLPLAFEIQTKQGMVGLVHAEPVPSLGWGYFIELLEQSEGFAIDSALRGREIAEGREMGCFGDAWRVFSGHTPAPEGVMQFGNMFCLDTGAVFGKHGYAKGAHLSIVRIDAPEHELASKRSMSGLIEIKGSKHWS